MSETVRTHLRVRAPELVGRGWLNTGGKSYSIKDLRGKFVLLDFWTFCCINCLHVLDELRPLEAEFADVLVTVGVHSPKFAHEAEPGAVAAAVERTACITRCSTTRSWHLWQQYAVQAWPTLVVIDPDGYVVARRRRGPRRGPGPADRRADRQARGGRHPAPRRRPLRAPVPASTPCASPARPCTSLAAAAVRRTPATPAPGWSPTPDTTTSWGALHRL